MHWAVIVKGIRIIGEGNTPTEALKMAVKNCIYNNKKELEEKLTDYNIAKTGECILTHDMNVIKTYY